MVGWVRGKIGPALGVLALCAACDGASDEADSDLTDGPSKPKPDASMEGDDGGTKMVDPLVECDVGEGDVFVDDAAGLGESALSVGLDGNRLHTLYLTTTCADAVTAAREGLGVRYAKVATSGTLLSAKVDVFGNDAAMCRFASDPALTVIDDVPVAYFLSRNDLGVIRAYREDISDPTSLTPLTDGVKAQRSLAATTLAKVRLVAWTEASASDQDTIWTVADDADRQAVKLVSEAEGFRPERLTLQPISKTEAMIAWSSDGARKGIFALLINKLGEASGEIQTIADSPGEVSVALMSKADDQGFIGAAAYTLAGTVYIRSFKEDGSFAELSQAVSQGASRATAPSITGAFSTGYAVAYRTHSLRDAQDHPVVQMTVTDSRGNVAGRRVLAEVNEGGGAIHLRQALDGRFFLAWADQAQFHAQRFLCF